MPSSGAGDVEEEEEFVVRPAEPGVQESPATAAVEKVRVVHGSDVVLVDAAGTPCRPAPGPKRPAGCRVLLQAFDLDARRLLSTRELPEPVGRMMPAGPDHVVSFYDHPKLIEVATGKVVQRWEDLDAGPEREQPSAMMTPPGEPLLAMDPARARFAIGRRDRITIIQMQR